MTMQNNFYHPLHPNPFPIDTPRLSRKALSGLDFLVESDSLHPDQAHFEMESHLWLRAKPRFSEAAGYLGRRLADLSHDDPEFSRQYFSLGVQIGHMACRQSFISEDRLITAGDNQEISQFDTSQERFSKIVELDSVEVNDWLELTAKYHRHKTVRLAKFIGRVLDVTNLQDEKAYLTKGANYAYGALSFEWARLEAEKEAAYQEAGGAYADKQSALVRDIMLPHKKQISGRLRR